VNHGSLDAFKDGIVRSTSFMVNLPGAEASVSELKRNPGLDVGLHVNLTMGRPVSRDVPSLTDSVGAFFRKPAEVTPRMQPAEAEREIRAQVARALELGIPLTHLDSHHHLHENDAILDILIKIAGEHRFGLRSYDASRPRIHLAGIPTPDHFYVDFYGEQAITVEFLLDVISSLREGVTELCCHPAKMDEKLQSISSYAAPRSSELKVLCDARVKDALDRNRVQLISFADLLVKT
jgi:predicted glycoside hydrolase/deacetylase ChbG (UPF0249 family)